MAGRVWLVLAATSACCPPGAWAAAPPQETCDAEPAAAQSSKMLQRDRMSIKMPTKLEEDGAKADVQQGTSYQGLQSDTNATAFVSGGHRSNSEEAGYYASSGAERCTIPIGSSAECRRAAEALGLPWDGDRTWHDRYGGCSRDTYGTHVNFNVLGDGDAKMGVRGGQAAVCRAGYYASKGAERCAIPIGSSEECQRAAEALGLPWDGDRTWRNRYSGCSRDTYGTHVNFNVLGDGDAKMGVRGGQVAVCRAGYYVEAPRKRCAAPIESSGVCEHAARALGLVWDGDRNWTDRYHGCSRDTYGTHVNFNSVGDGDAYMGIKAGQVAVCDALPPPD